jgi:hypothetical protein
MHIDPALLSAISALVGALMGGGASLAAAIYTQRSRIGCNEWRVRPRSGSRSARRLRGSKLDSNCSAPFQVDRCEGRSIGYLPGMFLFKLDRTFVSERGMTALGIIDVFDEARQRGSDVIESLVLH